MRDRNQKGWLEQKEGTAEFPTFLFHYENPTKKEKGILRAYRFSLGRSGSRHFWTDNRIAWWYRQNIFLYENSKCKSNSKEFSTKDSFQGAHIVHPDAFNEKAHELDIENASASNLLKALRLKIGNKFSKIWK